MWSSLSLLASLSLGASLCVGLWVTWRHFNHPKTARIQFAPWFLGVRYEEGDRAQRWKLSDRSLWWMRIGLLSVLASGLIANSILMWIDSTGGRGTVVLACGSVEIDPSWPQPVWIGYASDPPLWLHLNPSIDERGRKDRETLNLAIALRPHPPKAPPAIGAQVALPTLLTRPYWREAEAIARAVLRPQQVIRIPRRAPKMIQARADWVEGSPSALWVEASVPRALGSEDSISLSYWAPSPDDQREGSSGIWVALGRLSPVTERGQSAKLYRWRSDQDLDSNTITLDDLSGRPLRLERTDEIPYPLCTPLKSLNVAREVGWPSALSKVIAMLPMERRPPDEAHWTFRPLSSKDIHPAHRSQKVPKSAYHASTVRSFWRPFNPRRIWRAPISSQPTERSPLFSQLEHRRSALLADPNSPQPQAEVWRWGALHGGRPLLWATSALSSDPTSSLTSPSVVADELDQADQLSARFGFSLDDSTLTSSMAWPSLIFDLYERDRHEMSGCRVVTTPISPSIIAPTYTRWSDALGGGALYPSSAQDQDLATALTSSTTRDTPLARLPLSSMGITELSLPVTALDPQRDGSGEVGGRAWIVRTPSPLEALSMHASTPALDRADPLSSTPKRPPPSIEDTQRVLETARAGREPASPPPPWLKWTWLLGALILSAGLTRWRRSAAVTCISSILLWGLIDLLGGASSPAPLIVALDASSPAQARATTLTWHRWRSRLEALEVPYERVDLTTEMRGGAPEGVVQARLGSAAVRARGGASERASLSSLLEVADTLATSRSSTTLLITDGANSDGALDRPSPPPTWVTSADSQEPEVWISYAQARRLELEAWVEVIVTANTEIEGTLYIGGEARLVRATPSGARVTVQVNAPADLEAIRVRLEPNTVDGAADRLGSTSNYERLLSIPPLYERRAWAWGAVALQWLRMAQWPVYSPRGDAFNAPLSDQLRLIALRTQQALSLSISQLKRLAHWVERGGLLFLYGVDRQATPSTMSAKNEPPIESETDRWSALMALAPLTIDHQRSKTTPTHVTFIIDRSGSISRDAGGIGLEAIGERVRALVERLPEEDLISIISFGGGVELSMPPRPRGELTAIPTPTEGQGSTLLRPALEVALSWLEPGRAALWVLLSDGEVGDPPEHLDEALIERIRATGARMLNVRLPSGDQVSNIETLSRLIRGLDAPSIEWARFTPESLRAQRSAPVSERGAYLPSASPQWSKRVGGPMPSIDRYLRRSLKRGATSLATVEGAPLLAEWSIGNGRVIQLTSEDWSLIADQWRALFSPALGPLHRPWTLSWRAGLLFAHTTFNHPLSGEVTLSARGLSPRSLRWRPLGGGLSVLSETHSGGWAPVRHFPPLFDLFSAHSTGERHERMTAPPPRLRRPQRAMLISYAERSGGRAVDLEEIEDQEAPLLRALTEKYDPPPMWTLLLCILVIVIIDTKIWARR
jgi:hypothetical protein